MAQQIYNPELRILNKTWKGNYFKNDRFAAYNPQNRTAEFTDILKWQLGNNPQKEEKNGDQWRFPSPKISLTDFRSGPDKIMFLGHACFLMRMEGKTILTDPVFFDLPFIPRKSTIPVPLHELTGIDYILLSHDHRDHCDRKSLTLLVAQNPDVEILTTLKLGETLIKPWFPQVKYQEAGWYQQFYLPDGPEIYLMPASHWCKRGVFDLNNRLWGSFVIGSNGNTHYFGSDSGYETHFKKIREVFGEITTAMIGIGAYKPDYIMSPSHTSPEEAVQAFHDLNAKTLIPMHFGTYDLSDEPFGEPWRVIHEMAQAGAIQGELAALEPGKFLEFAPSLLRG